MICNNQQVEFQPTESEINCRMYVAQTILPGQVAFTKLTYDASADLSACSTDATSIESDELHL